MILVRQMFSTMVLTDGYNISKHIHPHFFILTPQCFSNFFMFICWILFSLVSCILNFYFLNYNLILRMFYLFINHFCKFFLNYYGM